MKVFCEYVRQIEKLIPNSVKKLMNLINSRGKQMSIECRLVGGCARDMILSIKPKDFDFAVNVNPDLFLHFAESLSLKCIPTGVQHGTITVVYENCSFEFTSLRKDVETYGRHAVVSFGSKWEEDAERRDFTFNALYIDENFLIYDYFYGLNDLFSGKLVFIGNAEKRIQEDYLRILRAFRFFCRFSKTENFPRDIERSIINNIDGLNFLSRERIRQEILFILESDKSYFAVFHMFKIGIFNKIWPNIKDVDYKKVSENLNKFCHYEKSSIARMAFLAKQVKINACDMNLRFSKSESDLINLIVNFKESFSLKVLYLKYFYLYGLSSLWVIIHSCLAEETISNDDYLFIKGKISKFLPCDAPIFPIKSKDIKGKKGKELGLCIKMLRNFWLDSNCSLTKEELLHLIK